MIEFKDKFIADALDVLSEIEETLLTCEENKVESASIETVFRGLHTLKGASGMYGFKNIEHLMHLIENVYDLIRAGKIELKKGIIDLTFLVVDHVASVLKLDDPRDEEQDFHTKKLENEISALLEFVSTGNTITVGSANKISVIAGVRTCYIRFPEDADFALRGLSPQEIIGNLEDLGTVVVRGFEYNADEKLWEVFLVTKESVDDVEDAFMFIADIVEFQTVAPINIFEIKSIADLIQTNTNRNLPHSLNEIKDLYKAHSEADIQEKKIKQKTAQNQKGLYLRVA